MERRIWIAAWMAVAGISCSAEEIELSAVFGDGMVLQRDEPIPIWGRATPGAKLTVTLAGRTGKVVADREGRFELRLDPLPAGGPHVLAIEGRKRIERRDVLVGEVWLGAGQSNMVMTLRHALGYEEALARAELPALRMFREESGPAEEPQWRGEGHWTVCSAATAGDFSAVLFTFGCALHEALGVPIGLIQSSMSNSSIESWTRRESQLAVPAIAARVAELDELYRAFDLEGERALALERQAEWEREVQLALAERRDVPPRPDNPVEFHLRQGAPGGLFNGKIAPLAPFGLRGVVWYQGEANTERPKLYAEQLPLLVNDWRAFFRRDDLAFAWVQLPNFAEGRAERDWPGLREAQRRSLALLGTGMAVTIDAGDPFDIHPPNKRPVGERLAAWALAEVYCRELVGSGPLYDVHEVRGSAVLVRFRHVAAGLVAAGGRLEGFELAGPDGAWHPAWAGIRGREVVVSSPAVEAPVAVRYGFAANPHCNLYNDHGLPASPFTSEWDPVR